MTQGPIEFVLAARSFGDIGHGAEVDAGVGRPNPFRKRDLARQA